MAMPAQHDTHRKTRAVQSPHKSVMTQGQSTSLCKPTLYAMSKATKIFSTEMVGQIGNGLTRRGRVSARKAARKKEIERELGPEEVRAFRIRMDMQALGRFAG